MATSLATGGANSGGAGDSSKLVMFGSRMGGGKGGSGGSKGGDKKDISKSDKPNPATTK